MPRFVTQHVSLDVRRLAREGKLCPWSQFEWIWRPSRTDPSRAITVIVVPDRLIVAYRMKQQTVCEHVPLLSTPLFHGGTRRWFRCSGCGRPVALLYHDGTASFRCRRCLGLCYESQYRPRGTGAYGRRHRLLTRQEEEAWRQVVHLRPRGKLASEDREAFRKVGMAPPP